MNNRYDIIRVPVHVQCWQPPKILVTVVYTSPHHPSKLSGFDDQVLLGVVLHVGYVAITGWLSRFKVSMKMVKYYSCQF